MQNNIFVRLHPLHRIVIGIVLAAIVSFCTPLSGLLKLLLMWDVFAFTFCLLCWIIFATRGVHEIRRIARQEDGSRTLVSVLILLACFASMLIVALLVLSKEAKAAASNAVYIPIAILGILLSWFMVHTVFTIHYAYLYYDDAENDESRHAAGLEFPGEDPKPNYIDFAYFAFVIGMTFQVSDVEISRSKLRRVALLHGLLSFGLNTFVVAITVNLIAGLRQ